MPEKKESGRKAGKLAFQPGLYIIRAAPWAGLRRSFTASPSDLKKLRWHIDQFLNDKQAGIKKIFFYLAAPAKMRKPDRSTGLFLNSSFGIGARIFS